jgi:hypothetical protein
MRLLLVLAAASAAACSRPAGPPEAAVPPPPPVKITNFYASPERIEPGGAVSLCYGVEQASTLEIEPPVERVWPALSRCFAISPKETTTYTLKAKGAGGEDTRSVTVVVDAALTPRHAAVPAPLIRFFAASTHETSAGRPVTLCYGTFDAVAVRIEPGVMRLEPTSRRCFSLPIEKTTTLTLVARGADGREERERVTVKVR